MQHPYSHELQIAERAVAQASLLTKRVQNTVGEVLKDDNSQVTIADFAAQAILIGLLHQAFPDDDFLGEENSELLRTDSKLCHRVYELVQAGAAEGGPRPASVDEMLAWIDLGGEGEGGEHGRFWVMDPIDGTAAFLRGQQYAVSLSLINDGREVLGVLGCPNINSRMTEVSETDIDNDGFGVVLSAVRGRGAAMRSITPHGLSEPVCMAFPLAKTPTRSIPRIVGCTSCQVTRHDHIISLARKFEAKFPSTEIWSSHIRYAALVFGTGNVQFWVPRTPKSNIYIWDHAGSQLIFTEMGGNVTDLDGKAIDFGAGRVLCRNRGLVVARAEIHRQMLKTMQSLVATD